jgi:hypothetical protein
MICKKENAKDGVSKHMQNKSTHKKEHAHTQRTMDS